MCNHSRKSNLEKRKIPWASSAQILYLLSSIASSIILQSCYIPNFNSLGQALCSRVLQDCCMPATDMPQNCSKVTADHKGTLSRDAPYQIRFIFLIFFFFFDFFALSILKWAFSKEKLIYRGGGGVFFIFKN